MKTIILGVILMFAESVALAQPPSPTSTLPATVRPICVFKGVPPPPAEFTFIQKIRVRKGTYGSVNKLVPKLAEEARGLGAHAIINFKVSQRFAFWPWRIVRPVVWGTAIKWITPGTVDCVAIGGTLY